MKKHLVTFYQKSPKPLRRISDSIISAIPVSFFEGPIFTRTLAFLEESQYWPKEKLQAYQMDELKKLLDHAFTNVPYYYKLFNEYGIHPKQIQDFNDFSKLPFLTKEIIRNNLNDLKAQSFPEKAFKKLTTGGSSGTPLGFYSQAGFSSQREKAFIASMWKRIGFQWGIDRRMTLRGSVVDAVGGVEYRPISKEYVCSIYDYDENHLHHYLDQLRLHNLKYIHGYVSTVSTFAQFLIEKGLTHQLAAVFGASEKVFPFQRELVKKAFNSRIFSWYGQTEQVVLAGECEFSHNYHIFPEYSYVELVNDEGKSIDTPGTYGEIVGTSFNNYVMPLIRYRTGDIGSFAPAGCKCGREYSLFEDVEGRNYEFIWTADGRKISLTGLIFGQHFKAFEHIKKMQIFQEEPGRIEIRIVRSSTYSKSDDEEIIDTIQQAAGLDMEIKLVYWEEIPATARGKHQFLIQKINTDRLPV